VNSACVSKGSFNPWGSYVYFGIWGFLFCKDTGKKKKEFPAVEDQLLLDCLYWLLSSVVRANTNLYCISQKTEAF